MEQTKILAAVAGIIAAAVVDEMTARGLFAGGAPATAPGSSGTTEEDKGSKGGRPPKAYAIWAQAQRVSGVPESKISPKHWREATAKEAEAEAEATATPPAPVAPPTQERQPLTKETTTEVPEPGFGPWVEYPLPGIGSFVEIRSGEWSSGPATIVSLDPAGFTFSHVLPGEKALQTSRLSLGHPVQYRTIPAVNFEQAMPSSAAPAPAPAAPLPPAPPAPAPAPVAPPLPQDWNSDMSWLNVGMVVALRIAQTGQEYPQATVVAINPDSGSWDGSWEGGVYSLANDGTYQWKAVA